MDIVSPVNAVITKEKPAGPMSTSPNPPENTPNDLVTKITVRLDNVTDETIVVRFTPRIDQNSYNGLLEAPIPLADWE